MIRRILDVPKRGPTVLAVVVIVLACSFQQKHHMASSQISKIDVYFLRQMVISEVNWPCTEFEKRIGVEMYTSYDKEKIARIANILKEAKPTKGSVNTRAKVLMYNRSGVVNTICVGFTAPYVISFNGETFLLSNSELADLIY